MVSTKLYQLNLHAVQYGGAVSQQIQLQLLGGKVYTTSTQTSYISPIE